MVWLFPVESIYDCLNGLFFSELLNYSQKWKLARSSQNLVLKW